MSPNLVDMNILQLPAELRAGILEELFIAGTYLAGKEVYVNEHFRCRQIDRETRRALKRWAVVRLVCHRFQLDADEVFFRHFRATRFIGALTPLESTWSSDVASFVLANLRHLTLEMIVGNSTMIVLRLELRKCFDTWSCEWKNDVYHDLGKDDIVSERRMIRSGLSFIECLLSLIAPGEGLCYDDIEHVRQIMARQCTVEPPSVPNSDSWDFEDYPARFGAGVETCAEATSEEEPPAVGEEQDEEAPMSKNKVDSILVEDATVIPAQESPQLASETLHRHPPLTLELQGRIYLAPAQSSKSFDQDLALLEDHQLITKYNLQQVRTSVVQKARRAIGGRCKSSARACSSRILGAVSRVSRTASYLQTA
ncbi:hypothetical protein DOTSEDRAFT_38105 [Dothistroma septosporum NZE10]|uniref:Uncharacterized protein n=1 Tax=Dothistroma septosporum (strain NZE10 / CBS 128990) TaxID=675120 RepID=N1PCR6_DOTSN|nr:hypothetical protein DOTSEDRAFT_38105 [Dothistroma septosporum NZE10]